MSARAMHYGQSRRSPRTVANGTRGPHRGQGRREMKRGVNSLRQALRPPTSPIHTHSRVSCRCPIAALPVLPRPHAERPRHRSLLSGRMDLSKGRDVQCDGASADEHRRRIGYRGQRAQGRGEPGYQSRRTQKAAHGSYHSPPSPSLRLVEPVDTSVGWRCRWGELVAAEGQMVSAPSVRG